MNTSLIEDRVQRGAELLDQLNPGWAERITVPLLQMKSFQCCVLGQLYDGYIDGRDSIGLDFARGAEEYGFSIHNADFTDPRWGRLTNAWRRQVQERLG